MVQIGMNARLFPSNWRPLRNEIAFAEQGGFQAIQLPGPEEGLGETQLADPLAEVRRRLEDAELSAVMEIVLKLGKNGVTATGRTPLNVLEANLSAITTLPCRYVHWHLVPDEQLSNRHFREREQSLISQFEQAVTLARQHDFIFGFEHNEPRVGFFASAEVCKNVLEAVPDLHFVWDLNHTAVQEVPVFKQLLPYVSVLHVSDTLHPELNYHWPLSKGNTEFELYFQVLREKMFSGPAILEIGGLPKSGGFGLDTDAALIDSRRKLEHMLLA